MTRILSGVPASPGVAIGRVVLIDGPREATGDPEAALDAAAAEGEKTMVDSLSPAVRALSDALARGASVAEALAAARQAGEEGMRATVPLQATKGRASYLGERSIGHQDPGATSTALILAALEESVAAEP